MGMTPSKEKSINITEFANLYNRTRPLGKDFMPLEPSFLKLLCEQGKIRYSELPAHDGRKKDVIMIPESELDTVDILLNGDEAIEKGPAKTMSTEEVATFLDIHKNNVAYLVRKGKLKARKIHNPHGGRDKYEFNENDVLKYAEEHPKRHYTKRKPNDGFTDLKKMDCDVKTKEYIMQLEAKNNELMASNASYADLINSLRKDLTALEEEKANWLISSSSSDKDIFEAYRRGFKDGFEMGGAH
jgi:hypothetical protein